MRSRAPALVAVLIAASPAAGIIIRHDRADEAYLSRASLHRFSGVGQMRGAGGLRGTGTLLSPDWILTAAHVADDSADWTFRLTGVDHPVAETIIHEHWTGDLNDNHDVALMRLAEPLRGTHHLPIATSAVPMGTEVDVAGYGWTGDGLSGIEDPGGQLLRAGTNRIEWDLGGFGLEYIGFYFDAPGSGNETDLEAMGAFNDSGGPVIAKLDGRWQIVGTNSFIQESFDGTGDGILGTYDDVHGAANIAIYADWIGAIIPSPGGLTFAGFGVLGLAIRRRSPAGSPPLR